MKKAQMVINASSVIALLSLMSAGPLFAQAVSADGVIESTSGGIKFPDGTVQATAVAPGAVADTGQTACRDEDGVSRDCAGTGEDGESQAGVAWPTPRFTDNGNGTVTDNLTGLIWLKDANCPGGTKSWQGALDWVDDLNTMSIACTNYTAGTFTDWRSPNIKELLSLVDYGEFEPALPVDQPFMNLQSVYWSSSTFVNAPGLAQDLGWFLNMSSGIGGGNPKRGSLSVWPVRGGQ